MITKIKIHSTVDLITNSSTVIFTYYDNCVEPIRDMVNEMLKVFGHEDVTFEDMFHYGIFLDELDNYLDYCGDYDIEIENLPPQNEDEDHRPYRGRMISEFIKPIIEKVLNGEIEKPKWMLAVETVEDAPGYGIPYANMLYLQPKDGKFKTLGEHILKVLNSVHSEESYN